MVNQQLELPCGVVLKNRLVKSAMSDSLGSGTGNATESQAQLYKVWAESGLALSIVGEVQVDSRFPENSGNLVLSQSSNLEGLQNLTKQGSLNNCQLWAQLGHAGALAQSMISHPRGPSALNIGHLKCSELSLNEVEELPNRYASAAIIAIDAGFTGVQIHAGHGLLLSQFLSPLFNHRSDHYGGDIEARSLIILNILKEVRIRLGNEIPIGIKLNSSDLLVDGLTEQDSLKFIKILDSTSIDLIEISGGTYFPNAVSSSDNTSLAGKPYYLDFAQKAGKITNKPLMITGGFKNKKQVDDALLNGSVSCVGLARSLVIEPKLASYWLNNDAKEVVFPKLMAPAKGGVTIWYTMGLAEIAEKQENKLSTNMEKIMEDYEKREEERCVKWISNFF